MVGLSRHTLIRRIGELEATAGVPLVIRRPSGIELTSAGRQLVDAAESIAAATSTFGRVLQGLAAAKGPVSISAPEGVASYLLGPQAAGLSHVPTPLAAIPYGVLPPLDILPPDSRADIEIIHVAPGADVPRPTEYRVRKLGNLRFRPVAARAFLEEHDTPASFTDLARYPLLQHAAYGALPSFRQWNDVALGSARRLFTAGTSSALHRTLLTGAGVTLLPDFSEVIDRSVVVLPIGEPAVVEMWAAALPEALSLSTVRRTWDAVCAAFDGSPWMN